MTETMILEFRGGQMRFSSGHFTIFSDTHRERLHGHNYHLEATVTAGVLEPGITFDYSILREKLIQLCRQLHSRFLIAGESPYLSIVEDEAYYRITFADKEMPFLKDDVLIMPLANITIEELSRWFVDEIQKDDAFIRSAQIQKLSIAVFNGETHGGRTEREFAQHEME